jgi:hypothetical protein
MINRPIARRSAKALAVLDYDLPVLDDRLDEIHAEVVAEMLVGGGVEN